MSNSVLRILDANFNRAREALRVMEESARFALDDSSLTAATKAARHELKEIFNFQFQIPNCSLIGARDTRRDVGTAIEGEAEYVRGSAEEVAIAAGKRLGESLRVLEEYAKVPHVADPNSADLCEFAKRIERLRYVGYDLERRLALTFRARQRFGDVRLYVLLTESLCRSGWFETAEAVIRGGAQCIQLREKSLSDAELVRRARRLAALCRDHGIIFIVNDRADIAVAVHAHGVHVGQDDISVLDARRVLDTNMIVGVSTHTIEQVQSAIVAAPEYIAVGPMFPSETKPQSHIAGPEVLSAASQLTSLPLVAIGGIQLGNAGTVRSTASTCAICVCSAIISDSDPEAATRKLLTIAR
ncbi:MAG: thiamine phosphate synthase [Planctomycetes bacterium]|nr:thiamine phosphate synthase [Planctomycetota bacterium]MBI3833558.1 thiamine phosphate synthase [Planctomycetota bacterium]